MKHKLIFLFLIALLFPSFASAQNGKLRGRVIDKETGEPLIGATVAVEGTTLGASTNIDGEYFILNVPPGAQTVKATYVGYAPVTISEVKISAGLTSTIDFTLSPTSVQVEPVSIVAERPLIQRNTTNTVLIIRREDFKDLPFRGIQSIIALAAGVVQQRGELYVRGGRATEVAYFIDGANVTNPFSNRQNIGILQEALEEFQLHSGGMTAEYGGANSGIIRTTLRTGDPKLKATINYRTDDFAKPGKEFLNTTSFGRRIGVFTIGGPVPSISRARFFVAAQHDYSRMRQVMFLEPFRFDSLRTDALGSRPAGELLPGPVELRQNYLPSNWSFSNLAQGTLLFDFDPIKIRFGGSYEFAKSRNGGSWPGYLSNMYGEKRNSLNEANSWLGNLRMTHVVNPTTFYEVGLSYQYLSGKTYDPDFGDDWLLYPDSIANEQKGYTGFVRRFQGPLRYSTIFGFTFLDPNTPNNSYSKSKNTSIGASIDFTTQLTTKWEVKVGGRLDSWVIRNFGIGNISNYLVYLYGLDGKTPRTFSSDYERRVRLIREGGIGNYGYDIDGNETDGVTFGDLTVDKPQKPLYASAYIQNKFEYNDLIVNLGVRYEYMDPKGTRLPQSLFDSPAVDEALNLVDEHQYVPLDAFNLVLPRVSFSFPVTDRTVFFAQYGKFAQFPSLNQLYGNTVQFSGRTNPATRQPYSLGSGPGWLMKPERST
ncbi:MAG: TonB-dependent receptor, partial [Bacteroidota bacterium]